MMATLKTIENPEIPGMESSLPLPPPPPQRSKDTESTAIQSPVKSTTPTDMSLAVETPAVTAAMALRMSNSGMTQVSAPPFPPIGTPSSFLAHPSVPPQEPSTPWWIIDPKTDSTDLFEPPQFTPFYDPATYNSSAAAVAAAAAVASAAQGGGKAKNKYFKRKSEFIDPAQDAEKVASAQRELSALMKPLKCDLCNAVMNSTLQAKLHYDGKPHQKKVSMFLNQSVKKLKVEDGQQVSSTTGTDWNTYCDICKTWFTSQTDATQHYAGKKHVRAANGGPRVRPSKKFQNQYSQVDSTGRFGIGTGFQSPTSEPQPTTAAVAAIAEPAVPAPLPGTGSLYTPPPYPTPLRCDLCGVSANRQDQLETHRRGARHLRMLRLNGLPLPDPATESEVTPTAAGPIDYSIYRTPSGQYYCAPCNLSLNSESSFAQHVESKKHKNQLGPKSPPCGAVVAKKPKSKKK